MDHPVVVRLVRDGSAFNCAPNLDTFVNGFIEQFPAAPNKLVQADRISRFAPARPRSWRAPADNSPVLRAQPDNGLVRRTLCWCAES